NSHPVSLTVSEGSSASFSVNAGGGGFLTYQWRHNGTDISGAYSNTLSLNSVELSDAGSYDVTVSNTQGSATSFSANLSVLSISVPVSITQQPYSQEINAGESVDLTVRTSGDGPFSYQWLFNGEELVGANSQDLSISNAGIEDTGLYSVVVSNASSEAYSQEALVSVNSLPSSLELSWSAPSTREDGSALESSEISAYVIEYAYNNTELNQSIRINST
ncbi:immunoglobulin domain-containing protein, partial [Oleiphilus sp. HI0061]